MATQKMKTRIVQKHDNSDNWSQATTFKPLDGEIIIYDDRPKEDSIGINQKKLKLKVGDGITPVTNLPTIHLDWNEIDEKPSNFTPTSHGHNADEVKFTDGETFQKKFNDGELKGQMGATGPIGPQGPAGRTPQKGTDYFTESDKQSFVNDVLTALPKWNWGSY